jgi:hypothetical protein
MVAHQPLATPVMQVKRGLARKESNQQMHNRVVQKPMESIASKRKTKPV